MIKLHLGCGRRDFGPDWCHIDGGDFDHLNKNSGTIDTLDFPNKTIDLIYASHLIAYWDELEVVQILMEWFRVLKPGGVLRLATPDFGIMTKLYQEKKVSYNDIKGPLYGRMYMNENKIYHKVCYDYNSLFTLLDSIGFQGIKQYNWRDTEHAGFDDHSMAYLNPKGDKEKGTLISLNVECIK